MTASLLGCTGGDDLLDVAPESLPDSGADGASSRLGDGDRLLQLSTARGPTLSIGRKGDLVSGI